MKSYIGSQQHWEDSVNDDYDERERHNKEQVDNRVQPDNREPDKSQEEKEKGNKGCECKQSILRKLDKKINWLHNQSLKTKGAESKSYDDTVNSFVIFKMEIEKLSLCEQHSNLK